MYESVESITIQKKENIIMGFKKQMKKNLIVIAIIIFSIFLFQSNAYAIWANNCTVTKINMNSLTGNSIVQATCDGTNGRVSVANSEPGANAIIATILTAISLNTTVNFDLFNAFDDSAQVVKGVQLNNPN